MMDICSAHGSQDSQPELRNVSILFFPPNTTSRLQPLDAGIIAAIKLRYRRRQMEFAVDMAEVGKGDIYKVDILSAMRWLTDVWSEITADTIFNCWRVTGIMGSDMTTEREGQLHCTGDEDIRENINSLISQIVPEKRRITIEELL